MHLLPVDNLAIEHKVRDSMRKDPSTQLTLYFTIYNVTILFTSFRSFQMPLLSPIPTLAVELVLYSSTRLHVKVKRTVYLTVRTLKKVASTRMMPELGVKVT